MQSLILLPCLLAVASAGYLAPAVRTYAAPAYAASTQYHSQNAYGEYNYGYAEPNAAKSETKSADGVVQGSYEYVAPNGQLIKNNYIADANGFRSNLAPTAPKDFALPAVGYAKAAYVAPVAAYAPAAAVVAKTYAAPAYGAGFAYRTAGLGYGAPLAVRSYGYAGAHALPAYNNLAYAY